MSGQLVDASLVPAPRQRNTEGGLSRTFGAVQTITRARRSSKPARPYIGRLISLS